MGRLWTGQSIMIGRNRRNERGFTLVELLVVLAVIALLAGLVAPMAIHKIRDSKESALKEDLHNFRKAIDDHYADNGKYPVRLEDLVEKKYFRVVPVDPTTGSDKTWVLSLSDDPKQKDGIVDVHSGSTEKSVDGAPYNEW